MGLLQTIGNSHEKVQGLQTIGNVGKVLWGNTCIVKVGQQLWKACKPIGQHSKALKVL